MATRLQLHTQRFEFEGLGFSMVLARGWKGIAMNPLHGAFVSSAAFPQDAVLNVRVVSPEELLEIGGELTAPGLLQMLRAPAWGTEPVALVEVSSPPYALVGATFPPAGERLEPVREWLVTDGTSLASCIATPLICERPELLAECEEMLRSLRFG